MSTRDEFEIWASQRSNLSQDSDGQYYSPLARASWDVWQARQQEIDALKARVASFDQWPNVDALRQCMIDTAEENAALKAEIENLKATTVPPMNSAPVLWGCDVSLRSLFNTPLYAHPFVGIRPLYSIKPDQSEHKLNMVPSGNQDELSDDEIETLAIKHIARNYGKLIRIPYQQTEQFRRIKAMLQEVLHHTGREE